MKEDQRNFIAKKVGGVSGKGHEKVKGKNGNSKNCCSGNFQYPRNNLSSHSKRRIE